MSDAAQRRLLDRLRPELSKTGHVRRLLATTHDLDADFFDGDLLGTALSVGHADLGSRPGQLALQRKLAELDYCGVLCEASAYRERPGLRTVVHPVSVRGARLHAKLVLVEYERAVRLLVGSANLTAAGYRHNREVGGELLVHDDDAPGAAAAAAVLMNAVQSLGRFGSRAGEFLAELRGARDRLLAWADSERAPEPPILWSDAERYLHEQFLSRWPAGLRVTALRIVSPFWSEDGSGDTPLRRLLVALRQRDLLAARCEVELLVEAVAMPNGAWAPDKDCPQRFYYADFPGVQLRRTPVDPRVDANDLELKLDLTASRTLHAKILVLESASEALVYAGSANFTRNGWGLRQRGGANVEAGWVFEVPKAQVQYVLPRAGGPAEMLASLGQPQPEPQEDDVEGAGFWPEYLLGVELAPAQADANTLELVARWEASKPAGVRLCLPLESAEEQAMLLATTPDAAAEQRAPLGDEQLSCLLRERHVLVVAPDGSGRALFPLNVAAGAARHRLPLVPGVAPPGEDALLAYYQGRISFDDLYGPAHRADAGDEDRPSGTVQRVDKSRIQAYQVRAFVDALHAIRRELLEVRGSRGALFHAFCGEVSPLALARHALQEVRAGRRSPTAGAFQLVELSALLDEVGRKAPEDVPGYVEMCAHASSEVSTLLDQLRSEFAKELGPTSAFHRYSTRVREGAA